MVENNMVNSTTISPDEINQTIAGSPVTYGQQVGLTVIITVFGLWSVSGNLLTILAITTRKCMRTKTNVFLLSLAISDLLSAAIASPLWLYRRTWGFNHWEIGQFPCTLYYFTDEATSYVTAMHIASFAIWRFIVIRWPHRMAGTKFRTIIIWVVTLWIIGIIFGGFVFSSFFKSIPKIGEDAIYSHWPMCSLNFQDNGVAKFIAYHTPGTTIFILLPMFVLIVTSLMIGRELYSDSICKSELRKVKEKRAVMQLALISTSFMVGYLPNTAWVMWTVRTQKKDKLVDYWTSVFGYLMLRFSECMNPIVYNVSSKKMRMTSMEIMRSICCCCQRKVEALPTPPAHISHSANRNDATISTHQLE